MDETIEDIWSKNSSNVGKIVTNATAKLLGVDAKGRCKATAARMLRLVDGLEAYTDKVAAGAFTTGVINPGAILRDDSLWPSPSQWALDFSTWHERLDGYRRALEEATHRTGQASCLEIFDTVTQPLLLGWYLPGTPGIVNPDVQTVPDIVTPFMLGNQLQTFRDWEFERLRLLVDDVLKNAKKVMRKGLLTGAVLLGGYVIGGALIIAGTNYLAKGGRR